MIVGEVEQKTNDSLSKIEDFETFVNAIGVDYKSEDVIFTGYL